MIPLEVLEYEVDEPSTLVMVAWWLVIRLVLFLILSGGRRGR